ncbi:MAG: GtrA family protein [Anaerolineae bacterium]
MGQTDTYELRRIVVRNPLDGIILAIARRFGDKEKEVERFLKFAIVGAIGAVIDFTTLFVLQATLLSPVEPNKQLKVALATTVAFSAAVISNFIWNRIWTYPDSRSRSVRRQLAQFTLINLIGWIGRTVWVSSAYHWLGITLMPLLLPEIQLLRPGYIPSESAEAKLGTMAAWLIGVIIIMIWNYTANRLWTYNDVNKTAVDTPPQSEVANASH